MRCAHLARHCQQQAGVDLLFIQQACFLRSIGLGLCNHPAFFAQPLAPGRIILDGQVLQAGFVKQVGYGWVGPVGGSRPVPAALVLMHLGKIDPAAFRCLAQRFQHVRHRLCTKLGQHCRRAGDVRLVTLAVFNRVQRILHLLEQVGVFDGRGRL